MKKQQLIGYVFSYTDYGDNADCYPRISSLYKTKKGCINSMKKDAKEYAEGEDGDRGGKINDYGDKIEVMFECNYYCLYSIHEVLKGRK